MLKKKLVSKILKVSVLLLTTIFTGLVSSKLEAQVAITTSAQTLYDDNIFLENGNKRPATFFINDDLLNSNTGNLDSGLLTTDRDGKENHDFITNLALDFSGKPLTLNDTIPTTYQFRPGLILFSEFNEQNRVTLDGNITTNLSENILPRPFSAGIINSLQSASNNLGVASGTATRTAQNYQLSGNLGLKGLELDSLSSLDLGYLGTYQKFLGELLLSDASSPNTTTAIQGVDFHSHTAQAAIRRKFAENLELGLRSSAGVQLFTEIHNQGSGAVFRDPSSLDRTNGELVSTADYQISRDFSFTGTLGGAYSRLQNAPDTVSISTVAEDGQISTRELTPSSDNTGLTYSLALNYQFDQASLVTLGSTEGFSTNIDGQRFINRTIFLNLVNSISESWQLSLGGRYFYFDNQSLSLAGQSDRYEASSSLTYKVTPTVSLTGGYNFSKQNGNSGLLNDTLGATEPDFTVNRLFFGINAGFVGLPL